MNSARNYYTVLSSFITFIFGIAGLILGYFYFNHKIKIDANVSAIERKRKRLDDLIARIDLYDSLVDEVIHFRFSNAKELKHLRGKISRSFETIEIMLELNKELLGLDESDVKTILRVNSFVDKNDIIMHAEYRSLKEDSFLSVKDDYVNLIQDARRICFIKVC